MNTTPQTIVLVHGAFAESASWNSVIPLLQKEGHTVIGVANPLRGIRNDAAYLRSVLESIDGPLVVAGHSYGGSVMTVAADGNPHVTALVYIASFQPDVGESTGDMANKFPGNQLGVSVLPVPFSTESGGGTDLYVDPAKFNAIFAGDVPPEVSAQLAATQRPIAEAGLTETLPAAAWKTIPSWSLIARQDLAIPLEASRFMAERAGLTAVEIDASHAVAVSQPEAVAAIILEAAAATARTESSVPA